jgi:hypothetical protein
MPDPEKKTTFVNKIVEALNKPISMDVLNKPISMKRTPAKKTPVGHAPTK